MRILYIHQYFATPQGTTGTRSYEIARAMQSAGHVVTMLTSSAQLRPEELPAGEGPVRRGDVAGIPCIVLMTPYDQTMGYVRRIRSFLSFMVKASAIAVREKQIDLIYATSTPLTVGVCALAAKWLRRRPYGFEVRDLWPDVPIALGVIRNRFVGGLLRVLEKRIYRSARFVVAMNQDLADDITGKLGGQQKPVLVVPNACDTYLFRPDRDGSAFREAHGLAGKTLCVHTGAMGKVNGLDAVLDAAVLLRDRPNVRFVLIGHGREKPHLIKRVHDEGLENVLILDALPKQELADVLATADVGLMVVSPIPILELNCANKYFDYLAAGLPIVLNYEGWQADILRQHEAGRSAAQDRPGDFVAAIRELADDSELRRTMANHARQVAESALNRQNVVRPLIDLIGELDSRPTDADEQNEEAAL
ncbi:glycosyltransferase family 4 protein [Phycisphaerales bacterium AB-hyl4]|uniref:Glycosyltransferase family 4 protein n=1 Tax=Natronomicrosphaera hydrolytica TaxID=3242702 RepID=A0ABV4U7U2_9BACT